MKKNYPNHFKTFATGIFLFICQLAVAQTTESLSIKDFAIWGGSAAPGTYLKGQGVFLKGKNTITGNIGSNHLVDVKEGLVLTGNIYSGNGIDLKSKGKITGNLFAWKSDLTFPNPAISGNIGSKLSGDLTANGRIDIKSGGGPNASTIGGKVAVPTPTASNYSGPAPAGGIGNTLVFPTLPIMPGITAFDNLNGSVDVTKTGVLLPGVYRRVELKGNQTLTFRGPGNYVFEEINNTGANNTLVFDLNNTSTGTINIFIKKNARWGKITVQANGNFTSRIFTEVHGTGSPAGFAFEAEAPGKYAIGRYMWLGNIWSPNGGISLKSLSASTTPHVIGALWSGTHVDINENFVLSYDAPAASSLSFIEPYYAPPAQGKVDLPNNIIGAELTSLSQNPSNILGIPDNEIFRFDGSGNVMIEVISKTPNDNTLVAQLVALGMTEIIDNGPHTYVITGFFPINLLTQLNTNPLIEYVRPLYPPILNQGQVTTQGDKTMKSDLVRERFGLDGNGVKIGVLSDSYNAKAKAQEDVDQEDLPGMKSNGNANSNAESVQVVQEYLYGGIDEGRAMLQIVHDIAPQSKLAFRTGFLSAGDFAKGILELADPALQGGKCDIIVDDLSYITEPFFRDGVVAKTVDQVVSEGVTYFTSAGNFGKRSYEAIFNGVTNTEAIPAPAQVHQFGSNPSEIYQSILLKPGSYTIVLQWDDGFHSLGETGVATDLDLYLVGANGFTLFGFNRSNILKDPFEVCPFTVKEETTAKIMVARASGNTNVRFKYIIFRGDGTILDYQNGNSTIVGHANSNGAISVGAMLYDSFPGITPVWPGVASFSSRGGTNTLENNTFITRNKPDIIAPNGVNTTVNLGGASFNDGDTYPNFFGTSAAAPHAAAVGALLIQGRKKFGEQTVVTPDEIRQQLISSTGKFSYLTDPFTFEGGYGYLQADAAALQIANARPIVDTIMSETPGGETGTQPFTVKVVGQYLTDNTIIQVDGVPVVTSVSDDKTEATATVPALNGIDMPFQLFNPAKSESGEDGGTSEPIYFFGGNQKSVIVKAVNKSKVYKAVNPSFDIEVTVDGIPFSQTGLTLEELKLDAANLTLNTIATPESRPGNYGIFVARTSPLLPDDSLITKYGFKFESGTLIIEKLPLKITPKNMQITYGEFPENIEYTYELPAPFDTDLTLLEEVKSIHRQYIPDNGLVVMNGITQTGHGVNFQDFENMGVLASYQSILNARKLAYQNGILKPLTDSLNTEQVGNQRFMVDLSVNSVARYKVDSAKAELLPSYRGTMPRGLLSLKALTRGTAQASVTNGQLRAMINGQLQAMINGEMEALVNGQLKALINGVYEDASDITFINGQLRALINGVWLPITNGQLRAMVNGTPADFELSVLNGQLRAIINGQEMPLVNGQLRAIVNGQLVAMINGQLKALINGQLVPLINGQLVAMVNGQLKAIINGQLLAMINGQLMVENETGELEAATNFTLANGQLRAIINGQLKAIINGQLKAMINGTVTDVPTTTLTLVNGQLRAIVNQQPVAMVNGQLKALINGQLKALVNGSAIGIENATQIANGQLRAIINGISVPIQNGQLKAMINSQLFTLANGQLMAIINGELTFVVFQNGQLKALINGQLEPLVNGQLKAMINGELQPVNSSAIVNGQLKAIINGEEWVFPNGQLKALINGQLKAMINSFDVTDTNNDRAVVVVDENDIELQAGDLGTMYAVAMITGNTAVYTGDQKIIPAAFLSDNFEVSYGMGNIKIQRAPLVVKPADTTKQYGTPNPAFRRTYTGLAFDDRENVDFYPPDAVSTATQFSNVGTYPISLADNGTQSDNYFLLDDYLLYETGVLTITPAPLTVRADDKTRLENTPNPKFSITYTGLLGDDTEDSVCTSFTPPTYVQPGTIYTELERQYTYSNVKINNQASVYNAQPGEALTLTGSWYQVFVNPGNPFCPGCISQLYIGMGNGSGGNLFTYCTDVSGLGDHSGSISRSFNAPLTTGVYYITQRTSWYFSCYQPDQGAIIHDAPINVIAVVIVGNAGGGAAEKLSTSTTASLNSSPGSYPITLAGCSAFNPNYTVTMINGTLTIEPTCTTDSHVWLADGTFNDESGTGNGTPVGGVTANGPGATPNFSFDGTGYIATGTGGSVSGTGDFEVSAWVKTTGTEPMVIIQQRDGDVDGEYILKIGGAHNQHQFDAANTGKAYFMMFDPVNNPDVIGLFSTTSVNDGNWHLIKGTRRGTNISLLVDGTVEATANTPGVVNLRGTIRTFIGSDQRDFSSYFNGLIDEVRVSICNPTLIVSSPISSPDATAEVKASTEIQGIIEENKVFPNPATHTIRVQLTEDVVNINEIQVINAFGKVNPTNARKINDGDYEVNISGIPKGLYFLKARTGSGIKTLKFVKM